MTTKELFKELEKFGEDEYLPKYIGSNDTFEEASRKGMMGELPTSSWDLKEYDGRYYYYETHEDVGRIVCEHSFETEKEACWFILNAMKKKHSASFPAKRQKMEEKEDAAPL